jgi:uncharacterized membrane protein
MQCAWVRMAWYGPVRPGWAEGHVGFMYSATIIAWASESVFLVLLAVVTGRFLSKGRVVGWCDWSWFDSTE